MLTVHLAGNVDLSVCEGSSIISIYNNVVV